MSQADEGHDEIDEQTAKHPRRCTICGEPDWPDIEHECPPAFTEGRRVASQ